MPAKSEKQRNFMGLLKGAKHGQKVSGKAKKAADSMTEDQIDDFIEDEDEQSVAKDIKKTGKHVSKGPNVPERKHFAGPSKPHKDKTKYDRKDNKKKLDENADIDAFINCLLTKNYASANKYLNNAVESKLLKKIEEELDKPLFHTYE